MQAEAGESYGELRGVSIQGTAEIVDAEPELSRLMAVLMAHHFPERSAEDRAAMTAQMVRKRVVVRVRPERVMSWDHRKLGPGAAP